MNKISKEEINQIFDGIPIESIYENFIGEWRMKFAPEHFEAARFRLKQGENFDAYNNSLTQNRIHLRRSSYYFINHLCYKSKYVLELPFEHRLIDRQGQWVNCSTNLENYLKYCHRSIQTNQGSILILPYAHKMSRSKLTDEQKESLCDILEEECVRTSQRICDMFFEKHNIRIGRSTDTRFSKEFHYTLNILVPIPEWRYDPQNMHARKKYVMNIL
ncbi:hypothetical protein RF11_00080 [Thelohanellus kitauei]|uniref:Uncharacterized protein n=1 Tax=Thelohanellus kitauei TaxID=669202 RepID=A0A0C2NIY1_THEKT|nr:hypothetical protein RF11_00080 [Thelohanellus kitauei]